MPAFKMQWMAQKPSTYLVINEGGKVGKCYRWLYGAERTIPYYDLLKRVDLDSMQALGCKDRSFKNQCDYLRKLCVLLYAQEEGNPKAVAKELSIALEIPLEVCYVFKDKKEEPC